MERNKIILKSCKIIQRELNKLNKMKCTLDLAGHTFTCFDNTIEAKEFDTDHDLDFKSQVVYEFSQYCP